MDRSFRVFSSERRFRFTEMEYALPLEHGPEALRRVLEWVARERYPVAFPVECRMVAADDALLSPAFERDTFYMAVHQYKGMEWRPYFEAVEAIAGGVRRQAPLGQAPHARARHPRRALPPLPGLPRDPRAAGPRARVRQRLHGPLPGRLIPPRAGAGTTAGPALRPPRGRCGSRSGSAPRGRAGRASPSRSRGGCRPSSRR